MSWEKFFEPHLVVAPEDPAPITILNLSSFNSLLILLSFSCLIKNFVSVGQFLIDKNFSVRSFAALTKCKFFF